MVRKKSNTSLDAYYYIRGNGIDLNQMGKIFIYLNGLPKAVSKTRSEISEATGICLQAICGRIATMIADGKIIELTQPRKCSISGRAAHPLKV